METTRYVLLIDRKEQSIKAMNAETSEIVDPELLIVHLMIAQTATVQRKSLLQEAWTERKVFGAIAEGVAGLLGKYETSVEYYIDVPTLWKAPWE